MTLSTILQLALCLFAGGLAAFCLVLSRRLRRLNDLQATTLLLSGNPQDSGKIRGHRFSRLPAGRAMLLDDTDTPAFVQLVNPLADEGATAQSGPSGKEYS